MEDKDKDIQNQRLIDANAKIDSILPKLWEQARKNLEREMKSYEERLLLKKNTEIIE